MTFKDRTVERVGGRMNWRSGPKHYCWHIVRVCPYCIPPESCASVALQKELYRREIGYVQARRGHTHNTYISIIGRA